jgi:hypothetical protein
MEGERKRGVACEDLEVFSARRSPIARHPSREFGGSDGRAAGSGRSDPAGFEIHLCRSGRQGLGNRSSVVCLLSSEAVAERSVGR